MHEKSNLLSSINHAEYQTCREKLSVHKSLPVSNIVPISSDLFLSHRECVFSKTSLAFALPTLSEHSEHLESKKWKTGKQLFSIFALIYGNFWIAACVSLQAPFFPKEAELKGFK